MSSNVTVQEKECIKAILRVGLSRSIREVCAAFPYTDIEDRKRVMLITAEMLTEALAETVRNIS